MTLDSNDAKRALADIESATDKSSALRGYASAGNYLIVWGVVWIVGGAASFISPAAGRLGWTVAVLAGTAISIALGVRAQNHGAASKAVLGKVLTTMLVMALISAALSYVLNIGSLREATALQSLLVAGAYMVFGAWRGARVFALGFALGAAVLVGWIFLPAQFEAFIGLTGGLMLAVSGFWLRRA